MDGSVPWTCGACTYQNEGATSVCAMCSTDRRSAMNNSRRLPLFHHLYHHNDQHQQQHHNLHDQSSRRRNSYDFNSSSRDEGRIFSFSMCTVPRLLAGALSGALTGMFAVVGAFTGAVTGALAGRATDSGLLRGAGLGAVAGAVLSVEVLEASRAYWHSEQSGSHQSSVAEFIEDFLNGRFAQDQHTPSNLSSNHWQVNVAEMSYEDLYEMFGPGESAAKGASEACIGKLPQHIVTEDFLRDASGENICCAICLQELMKGETARCLPLCSHVFHMLCVDKWLVRHGSCPICRQEVQSRA